MTERLAAILSALDMTRQRRKLSDEEELAYESALSALLHGEVALARCPVIGGRETLSRIVNDRHPETGDLVLLPAELFEIVPWGHRLVIVREKPVEATAGGIVIPQTARRDLTTGWVVSIGDRVGLDDGYATAYPGLSPFSPPEGLIGQRVTFAKYGGTALFLKEESIGGTGYESRFTLMTDGDIYFHYHAPQGEQETSER